jgi:hypothetical protein
MIVANWKNEFAAAELKPPSLHFPDRLLPRENRSDGRG